MSAKVLANLMGWEKTFKDVNIPNLEEVNAQNEQRKAVAGNIAAAPEITQLAGIINRFQFEEIQKMMEAASPEYRAIRKQEAGIIRSELDGELTKQELAARHRSRGYKSYASGFAGSPMAGAAEALDEGDARYERIRMGFNHADQWLAQARLPALADMSGAFWSTGQQVAHATSERNNRWNFDFLKAQQAAMPTGTERALTGLTDWVEGILASAATMGLSNATGGAIGGSSGAGATSMFGGGGMGGAGAGSGGGGTSPDPYGLGTGWYPGGGNGFANSASGG